jgi:hypothetical protein
MEISVLAALEGGGPLKVAPVKLCVLPKFVAPALFC